MEVRRRNNSIEKWEGGVGIMKDVGVVPKGGST